MDKIAMPDALKVLRDGDEKALRELQMPRPKTEGDVMDIINAVTDRQHDYGTCVYAMSIAAEAAFNLVAHKLGVTGFQASCADMDILKRTRSLKSGFALVVYEHLLYPQYRENFDRFAFESLLRNEELKEWLRDEATKKLAENGNAHPEVVAHWKRLAA